MASPSVTVMPPAPVRAEDDPETYIAKVDVWNPALNVLGQEVQAVGDYVSARAAEIATVFDGAGFVSTSITPLAIGSGAKTLFVASGLQLANGMNITAAVTASPAINSMFAPVDAYNIATGQLDFTVEADDVKGSGTYSAWTVSLSGPKGEDATLVMPPEVRTSNTAMTPADSGKSIEGSGTFTQTYNAPATLGVGWFQPYTNLGTGIITLALATNVDLHPGETALVTCNATVLKAMKVVADLGPHVVVQDQKSSGTAGGSGAPGGTRVKRTLNTMLTNRVNAILSSNELTLSEPGRYRLDGWALAFGATSSRLYIENITDGTIVGYGPGSNRANSDSGRDTASAEVTITTTPKAFALTHRVAAAQSANDFGLAVSFGDAEIYAELRATRRV